MASNFLCKHKFLERLLNDFGLLKKNEYNKFSTNY